jgi:hypothetical protein
MRTSEFKSLKSNLSNRRVNLASVRPRAGIGWSDKTCCTILCCHLHCVAAASYQAFSLPQIIQCVSKISRFGRLEILLSYVSPVLPWGPPSFQYIGYRVSFPGVKRPGHGVNHPFPSSAEVKVRVELSLYSPCGPSWSLRGRTLHLPSLREE